MAKVNGVKVCESGELLDGGNGQRFSVMIDGRVAPAFVVRVEGKASGYLNRCRHVPVELDWDDGDFLDESGKLIICTTHGAAYDAATGACLGGPCGGQPLFGLDIDETAGAVYWRPSESILPLPNHFTSADKE
ncbi:MAG: Rieske (2Fe-2S) protein [Burkholderiaceae bacterium]|jgi:nitrite reductase/ring-hydroxylating ferredoxin subunit